MPYYPLPCRSCPVLHRRACRMQPVCTRTNAWYRARRDVLLRRFLIFFQHEEP